MFVGLACLLPLLETTHIVIKNLQQRYVFVCDYMATVKGVPRPIWGLYNDLNTSYISNAFKDFKDVSNYKHGIVTEVDYFQA
jgi:hypothetical protein